LNPLRWLGDRFKDLFYDPTNSSLDIGRVFAAGAYGLIAVATHHNAVDLKLAIDLSPTGLPGGLALMSGALATYIWHDRQQAGNKQP
jgi:hypothetical protein